ncbi:MAG: hypothetical protein PHY99_05220 [Bacteroidales bacterium]|nr:hypothetical protein [Bacteroidales bacterium]
MESLNINNYEIWFIEYLDGNLSNEQLDTLLDFLEQHPELKDELRSVSGVSLVAGHETFSGKKSLLKDSSDIPGISFEDQLCIARMENDLAPEKARLFDERLEKDLKLRANYTAFCKTRLNPADTVVFPDKGSLRKKTVFLSPWIITAISSAAVLFLAWFLWPHQPETDGPVVAKVEQPAAAVQSGTRDSRLETRDSKRETREPRRETRDAKPVTRNPKPETREPKPETKPVQREAMIMNPLASKAALAGPRIPDEHNIKLLYASTNLIPLNSPAQQEDALTIPQFALRLFREKILGQDRQQVKETQFSLWEVAGAGVNKFNALAGTNMKLNREYDSKGDILAVSFNSRLLDVESPVRGQ